VGSEVLSSSVHLNNSSDSSSVEKHLELHLEKKAGRVFGPPGNKRLLVVVDSANMPRMDEFGTQSALAFLRQHFDYSSFYDREKMTLKEVKDVQYVASMNPSVGARNVDTRFLRHFATFSCPFPSKVDLQVPVPHPFV
jgi:dynein heavy chain, axonemal